MARTSLDYENMFETGKFELMSVNHSARSGGIIRLLFSFFLDEGMLCVLIRIASFRRF